MAKMFNNSVLSNSSSSNSIFPVGIYVQNMQFLNLIQRELYKRTKVAVHRMDWVAAQSAPVFPEIENNRMTTLLLGLNVMGVKVSEGHIVWVTPLSIVLALIAHLL